MTLVSGIGIVPYFWFPLPESNRSIVPLNIIPIILFLTKLKSIPRKKIISMQVNSPKYDFNRFLFEHVDSLALYINVENLSFSSFDQLLIFLSLKISQSETVILISTFDQSKSSIYLDWFLFDMILSWVNSGHKHFIVDLEIDLSRIFNTF